MAITITVPNSSAALTADVAGTGALSAPTAKVNHAPAKVLVAGTGATQVGKLHSAQYLVSTGTPVAIDLTAAADPATGAVQNIGFVSRILVSNESVTATQNLTIGGGANPLFALLPFTIGPGGHVKIDLGDQEIATSGTVKNLLLTLAAGTNVPINVTVFGR